MKRNVVEAPYSIKEGVSVRLNGTWLSTAVEEIESNVADLKAKSARDSPQCLIKEDTERGIQCSIPEG